MRISIVGGHKTFYPFFRDPEDFTSFESAQNFVEQLAGMTKSLYVCVLVEVNDVHFKYVWGGPLTIQQTYKQASKVMELRAQHVEEIFFACIDEGGVVYKGLREYAVLSRHKLAFHSKSIIDMLSQVQDTINPTEFHIRKDGEMWTQWMQLPERLIILGVAVGWCQISPEEKIIRCLSTEEQEILPYLLMAGELGVLPQLVTGYKSSGDTNNPGETVKKLFNLL